MIKQKGFTLLEILTVMVIVGIIMGSMAVTMYHWFSSYFMVNDLTSINLKANLVMGRMTRDLREIAPTNLVTATSTSLSFTDNTGTLITYSRSGTQILRQQGVGVAEPLSNDIQNAAVGFQLTYLQNDAATVAVLPATIYYITVSLQYQITTFNGIVVQVPFNTTIYLRSP